MAGRYCALEELTWPATTTQLARALGVSGRTVTRAVEQELLTPCGQHGRAYLFSAAEARQYRAYRLARSGPTMEVIEGRRERILKSLKHNGRERTASEFRMKLRTLARSIQLWRKRGMVVQIAGEE